MFAGRSRVTGCGEEDFMLPAFVCGVRCVRMRVCVWCACVCVCVCARARIRYMTKVSH